MSLGNDSEVVTSSLSEDSGSDDDEEEEEEEKSEERDETNEDVSDGDDDTEEPSSVVCEQPSKDEETQTGPEGEEELGSSEGEFVEVEVEVISEEERINEKEKEPRKPTVMDCSECGNPSDPSSGVYFDVEEAPRILCHRCGDVGFKCTYKAEEIDDSAPKQERTDFVGARVSEI